MWVYAKLSVLLSNCCRCASSLHFFLTLAFSAFHSFFRLPWRLPLKDHSTRVSRHTKKPLWSKARNTRVPSFLLKPRTTTTRQGLQVPRDGEKPYWASSSLCCHSTSPDLL